ncbi:MAG: hypothetical protein ACUVV5_06890 [Candidatus Aminicenantales bacterium]
MPTAVIRWGESEAGDIFSLEEVVGRPKICLEYTLKPHLLCCLTFFQDSAHFLLLLVRRKIQAVERVAGENSEFSVQLVRAAERLGIALGHDRLEELIINRSFLSNSLTAIRISPSAFSALNGSDGLPLVHRHDEGHRFFTDYAGVDRMINHLILCFRAERAPPPCLASKELVTGFTPKIKLNFS